jgi:hypothetical protein
VELERKRATIAKEAEKSKGPSLGPMGAAKSNWPHAFEAAGIEFIPENGRGAGVRMKKWKLN